MKRKRHLLDNQINVNLLTKIYFSVIFLLAIKLKSICNLHEHLSSLFWFVATEGVSVVTVVVSVVTVDVSVVSLMFLSCLKQVYESAMRLQDEHRGLKSLYSSNFDVADKVSTEIYCFSSKFDEL